LKRSSELDRLLKDGMLPMSKRTCSLLVYFLSQADNLDYLLTAKLFVYLFAFKPYEDYKV